MDEEYSEDMAPVIAMIMTDVNARASADGVCFAQQHLLHKGLQLYKERGEKASVKEVDQLHKRNCFTPILISELTPEERKKAVQALMFLTEKREFDEDVCLKSKVDWCTMDPRLDHGLTKRTPLVLHLIRKASCLQQQLMLRKGEKY